MAAAGGPEARELLVTRDDPARGVQEVTRRFPFSSPGAAATASFASSARNFRIARNRCTRTVDSFNPVSALTSRDVRPSTWLSTNTERCRSGSFASASAICRRRSRPSSACSGDSPPGGDAIGQVPFRRRRRRRRRRPTAARLARHRQQPAFPARARLDPVQASVDQDAREPDVERQLLAKRREVLVRLHERVLHRLVRFGRIAQVVIRDPRPRGADAAPRARRTARARPPARPAACMRLDGGGGGGVRFAGGDEGR